MSCTINTVNSPFVVFFLMEVPEGKNTVIKNNQQLKQMFYPLTAADKLTLTHLKRPNVALMAVILVLNFNSLEISSFAAVSLYYRGYETTGCP